MMGEESIQYAIHVASFRDKNRAERQVTHIAQSNFPAFFKPVDVGGQIWFRVYVGKYSDIEEAKATKSSLTEKQIISYSSIIEM